MRKSLMKICWNIQVWAVQKHVNLVDLIKSFSTNIYLQKSASIQPRTSHLIFIVLAASRDSIFTERSSPVRTTGHTERLRQRAPHKLARSRITLASPKYISGYFEGTPFFFVRLSLAFSRSCRLLCLTTIPSRWMGRKNGVFCFRCDASSGLQFKI